MNRLQDFTFFSQLMANANMGWWKANLSTANYECSDFIVELLGLDQTGVISFEDFNKPSNPQHYSLTLFISA
ncbi:hypothetical protein NXW38_02785 [Bacteroides ovatus]|nr:hypothetical protein [Bacteroides ovatus]